MKKVSGHGMSDVHLIPRSGSREHVLGAPHACRCEPTVHLVEINADGAVWRRVRMIRHGHLR